MQVEQSADKHLPSPGLSKQIYFITWLRPHKGYLVLAIFQPGFELVKLKAWCLQSAGSIEFRY